MFFAPVISGADQSSLRHYVLAPVHAPMRDDSSLDCNTKTLSETAISSTGREWVASPTAQIARRPHLLWRDSSFDSRPVCGLALSPFSPLLVLQGKSAPGPYD